MLYKKLKEDFFDCLLIIVYILILFRNRIDISQGVHQVFKGVKKVDQHIEVGVLCFTELHYIEFISVAYGEYFIDFGHFVQHEPSFFSTKWNKASRIKLISKHFCRSGIKLLFVITSYFFKVKIGGGCDSRWRLNRGVHYLNPGWLIQETTI